MVSITGRIVGAGLFLLLLDLANPMQARSEEVLREMPKSQQVEELPQPQELRSEMTTWSEPDFPVFERPFNCTRINRYEVWQFYEVGHQGRFRPRVIYSAYGAFYLDDGRPYPWVSNHSLDFMPYAVTQ
ncbi:MAG TPA: hypothetical protein VKU02_02395 [Gemmataceae bacterium]|nr:hypothetical protein [Gemmataceae bacterium]